MRLGPNGSRRKPGCARNLPYRLQHHRWVREGRPVRRFEARYDVRRNRSDRAERLRFDRSASGPNAMARSPPVFLGTNHGLTRSAARVAYFTFHEVATVIARRRSTRAAYSWL